MWDSPAVRRAKRNARTAEQIKGCDTDIVHSVCLLTDPELIKECQSYTGFNMTVFGEEVLCMEYWHMRDVLYKHHTLPPLLTRMLRIAAIRMRQRQRDGKLPDGVWCPSCGRGDTSNAVARVKYVTLPDAETLFLLSGMDDREG